MRSIIACFTVYRLCEKATISMRFINYCCNVLIYRQILLLIIVAFSDTLYCNGFLFIAYHIVVLMRSLVLFTFISQISCQHKLLHLTYFNISAIVYIFLIRIFVA